MRVRIKICGLADESAVEAAAAAGVDAVGFVFAPSPREVTPERAVALARRVPPGIARVAVFRHPSPALVHRVVSVLAPDWIQTDADDLPGLGPLPPVRVLPVFRDGPDAARRVAVWSARSAGPRPRILFEGPESGSGRAVDPGRAATLARRTRLVLAGGLSPRNVAALIRTVRPYGVDVSSGVESERGVKDPPRIAAFVREVRTAERAS